MLSLHQQHQLFLQPPLHGAESACVEGDTGSNKKGTVCWVAVLPLLVRLWQTGADGARQHWLNSVLLTHLTAPLASAAVLTWAASAAVEASCTTKHTQGRGGTS